MDGNFISAIAEGGTKKYQTILRSRIHSIFADEPEDLGGEDTGPKPGELLCMSLAACTAITLEMYAARKLWDTGKISVFVKRFMDEFGTRFEIEISFEKTLDTEIKERMMLVAKKCPIHKILTNPIAIETKLNEDAGFKK